MLGFARDAGRGECAAQLAERVGVRFHGLLDGHRVAAAHGHYERGSELSQRGIDQPLPPAQTVHAYGEASQPIAAQRVGPRQVEHEFGREPGKDFLQGLFHRRQIGFVPGAVGKPQVQVAGFLAVGPVALPVHRAGEHGGVALEDRRVGVALVYVQIDDGDTAVPTVVAEIADRHGDVVEQAISRAPAGVGVMRAAAQDPSAAVAHGVSRGRHGSIDRRPCPVDQALRKGQPDFALGLA